MHYPLIFFFLSRRGSLAPLLGALILIVLAQVLTLGTFHFLSARDSMELTWEAKRFAILWGALVSFPFSLAFYIRHNRKT